MFGKVDVEWVYPYKCNESPIAFNKFIDDTTDKYIQFIREISSHARIIYVMGLHLPSLEESDMLHCINDYGSIEDVSLKSSMDMNLKVVRQIGSLKERTNQILYFNNILKEKIQNVTNCKYIDITDELLDTTTNTCKEEFIAKLDHHLIRHPTGLAWFIKHLRMAF